MKELREYQQSEAYKMCTEKIQEKKIKKGGLWEQWLPGSSQVLPEPVWDLRLAPEVTSFLPCRGCGCSGCECPTQRAPAQGKALSHLPVCGETEAHCTAGQVWVGRGSSGAVSLRFLEGWEAEHSWPGRASPHPVPVVGHHQPPHQPGPKVLGSPLVGSALPNPLLLVPQAGECSDTFSTFDVPIFTEEFLDQNKGRSCGGSLGSLYGGTRS